jgi:hypothetical protein
MVGEIEALINKIFSSPLAKTDINCKGNGDLETVSVRTILDNTPSWEDFKKRDAGNIKIIDCQRYVRIRNTKSRHDYVATQALNEIMIIFRRIEKLYNDEILKDADLADLWREIIPFCGYGRLTFYKSYSGIHDIQCIIAVLFHTALACHRRKDTIAVNWFKEYYHTIPDDESAADIRASFRCGARLCQRFGIFGKVYGILCMMKFNKIIAIKPEKRMDGLT